MKVITTSPMVKTYTLEEFWALPEPEDHSKMELIGGVLYMAPPPDEVHDYSTFNLSRLFFAHLESSGDRGVLLSPRAALWTGPDTYVEPDLFYISARTLRQIDPKHRDRADLVVEILSSSSETYDRRTKSDTYAALRVRELWLVDPRRYTIEVRVLKKGARAYGTGKLYHPGQRVRSVVLPGFSPAIDEIFLGVVRGPRKLG